MNILHKTRVYTASPMEKQNTRAWRAEFIEKTKDLNLIVFDPYEKPFLEEITEDEEAREMLAKWRSNGEYDKISERMRRVRNDDLRITDIVDFGVIKLDVDVFTMGTIEELACLNRSKKPCFVFVEQGKKAAPFWLFGMIPHEYIFDDLNSLVEYLKKINSGEIPLDTKRWRLLKPEYR